MNVSVFIEDRETGEVQIAELELLEDTAVFMFEEGNYACDCNRSLFFRRAKGEEPEFDEEKCGDGRFRVVKMVPEGATESIYSE